MRFQLCKGLLDRVEVEAVGREEQEPGTDALNGGAHGGCLVARQVVQFDHVATGELGHENAGDVGEERVGIHRPIEHPWRDHAGAAQPGCEGGGLPMTEGDPGAQALAPPAAAMPPGHVGGRPGFVDEHQSRGVEIEQDRRTMPPLAPDAGTILLGRVPVFLRVIR